MNMLNSLSAMEPLELRRILDDALRFWELRRIPYNVVLVSVVAAWAAALWHHYQPEFIWPALLMLFVMAALANVLYSAAYCLDVFIQFSSFRDLWRRYRWMLWVAGTILAIALANVWILSEFH